MTDYIKNATDAGDQYLAALAVTQEQFLKLMQAAAARTSAVAPQMLAPFGRGVLPSTSEVVEVNFAFAEKLLKQQHAFTEQWLAARMPASTHSQ